MKRFTGWVIIAALAGSLAAQGCAKNQPTLKETVKETANDAKRGVQDAMD